MSVCVCVFVCVRVCVCVWICSVCAYVHVCEGGSLHMNSLHE